MLHAITDSTPDPETASNTVTNRCNKANKKARANIVFNLGTEPIAVITSLLGEIASVSDIWKNLISSYEQ